MRRAQEVFFKPISREEAKELGKTRTIIRVYDDNSESELDTDEVLEEALADPYAEFALDLPAEESFSRLRDRVSEWEMKASKAIEYLDSKGISDDCLEDLREIIVEMQEINP